MGGNDLPQTIEAKEMKLIQDSGVTKYPVFWEAFQQQCRVGTAIAGGVLTPPSFNPGPQGEYVTLLRRLIFHAMREMIHEPYEPYPTFLYGRKFAMLNTGDLVLVPASAREGDVVCYFTENVVLSYALRPRAVDAGR
jgi:hypothetical protein